MMRRDACLLLLLGVILAGGCGQPIDTIYGRRSTFGHGSVNGTAVLAEVFAQSGHRVRSWAALSPALEEVDVIVWFPDDFEAPPSEAKVWLENWLMYTEKERTLIYVGRDFESAGHYWDDARKLAPANLRQLYAQEASQARSDARQRRNAAPAQVEALDWFRIESGKYEKVKALTGPWAVGVDAKAARIERRNTIVPDNDMNVLLATGDGDPLVAEMIWSFENESPSRLIVVENGSYLLNYPLVNHEHRKLAGKLVLSIGQERKKVVFLESFEGGPPIRDTDPSGLPPSGLGLLAVWPIGAALAQIAALGIVFALAKWPIFGLPRRLPPESTTDFSAHIQALGELLQETRDRKYAEDAIHGYHQLRRHDS